MTRRMMGLMAALVFGLTTMTAHAQNAQTPGKSTPQVPGKAMPQAGAGSPGPGQGHAAGRPCRSSAGCSG